MVGRGLWWGIRMLVRAVGRAIHVDQPHFTCLGRPCDVARIQKNLGRQEQSLCRRLVQRGAAGVEALDPTVPTSTNGAAGNAPVSTRTERRRHAGMQDTIMLPS